ncbi:MAG: hypothetical protein K6A97_00700 [Lachnospiraceae bacterium]|nr:hypothetical protein [Lachnospiraceae bacterium]
MPKYLQLWRSKCGRIIVCTNSKLAALKNYESVGFQLYDRKPNGTESAYSGDYLYYEIVL